MRNWTKILLAALGVLVFATSAWAWERQIMRIHTLENDTIKNAAGTTVIDVDAGTATLDITGDVTGDITGDITGDVSGDLGVFTNVSGTFYGDLTGDVDATTGVFENLTAHGTAKFGTTTGVLIDNGGITSGGIINLTGVGTSSLGAISATDIDLRGITSSTTAFTLSNGGNFDTDGNVTWGGTGYSTGKFTFGHGTTLVSITGGTIAFRAYSGASGWTFKGERVP